MTSRRSALRALAAVPALLAAMPLGAWALGMVPDAIPAHARLRFHVLAPISSATSHTGERFSFAMLAPVDIAGTEVVAAGAVGRGTIFLSGHAGINGHEGDLTLRLDDVPAEDGREVRFADQRFEINGRNRKVMSGVLGFVPYVGMASMFIRGSDIHVSPDQPIETVLARPAPIAVAAPDATEPPAGASVVLPALASPSAPAAPASGVPATGVPATGVPAPADSRNTSAAPP